MPTEGFLWKYVFNLCTFNQHQEEMHFCWEMVVLIFWLFYPLLFYSYTLFILYPFQRITSCFQGPGVYFNEQAILKTPLVSVVCERCSPGDTDRILLIEL